MEKQLTWNPLAREWEMMTPQEWARVACGYTKDANIPQWKLDFKLNLSAAVRKYTHCDLEYAALYYTDVMIRLGLFTPEEQYPFCLFIAEHFVHEEIDATLGNIYRIRETLNALSAVRKKDSGTRKRRERNRR